MPAAVAEPSSGQGSTPSLPRRERGWRVPLFLVALALGHRALLALLTTTLSADSALYLRSAELYAQGKFGDALLAYGGLHPLYPLLISWFGRLVGDFVAGGYVVSVVAGSLAVIPLHSVVRTLTSPRLALWAGLLYALHPELAMESSEVMTTGLFLLFFLGAISLFVLALRSNSPRSLVGSGVSVALAFMTRPEGVLLLPAFAVGLGIELVRRRRRGEPGARRLLAGVGIGAAAALLICLPYALGLRVRTGAWSMTPRATASFLWGRVVSSLRGDKGERPSTPEASFRKASPLRALGKVNRALYPYALPFLAVGLALGRRRVGRWSELWLLWGSAFLTAAPALLAYLLSAHFRPSHRYFLPATALMLPWMAAGLTAVYDGLARTRRGPRWGAALLGCFALVLLVRSVRWRRPEERSFLEAGRWLRAQPGEGPRRIVSSSDKISYYGGCDHLPLPPYVSEERRERARVRDKTVEVAGNVYDAYSYMSYQRAAFLVVDADTLGKLHPDYFEGLRALGFEQVGMFPPTPDSRLETVWVFRLNLD